MNSVIEIVGGLLACSGAIFLFLAALGVVRMPDIYNRMQTGTKATTLGTIMVLGGITLAQPQWAGKLILVILFLVLTNPVSSHALARAAHYTGIPLAKGSVRDELKKKENNNKGDNS